MIAQKSFLKEQDIDDRKPLYKEHFYCSISPEELVIAPIDALDKHMYEYVEDKDIRDAVRSKLHRAMNLISKALDMYYEEMLLQDIVE